MAEGSVRTKLATVALVIVGFALGFAEFIVIGITPDIAEEYGISLASAGNLVGFFAISYAVSTPIIVLSTGRFRRFPLFVTFLAVFNAGNLSGHRGSYVRNAAGCPCAYRSGFGRAAVYGNDIYQRHHSS